MSKWMTTTEAAAYARCSPDSIRDAAGAGDLDGSKITPNSTRSKWLFTAEDLDRWLERGRVTGGIGMGRRRRKRAA